MNSLSKKTFEEARAAHKGLRRAPMRSKPLDSPRSTSLQRKGSVRSTKPESPATGGKAATGTLRKSSFRKTRSARQKESDKLDAQWRQAVRERDNFTCRWPGCSYSSRHIHAHHISTRKQRPDLRRSVANGAAICPDHHRILHDTVEGRQMARATGLLGTETYEKAMKEQKDAVI